MSNRVTIKDIAKQCNVSTATVSYVINDKEGQSISDETRSKILHVVNMLNYKPSVIAKNLRTIPQHRLVAVFTDETSKYLNRLEYLHILDRASEFFFERNLSIVYGRSAFHENVSADALLAVNLSKEAFHAIGKGNFIPLIALDTVVDDPLFFQVTTDYARIKAQADKTFSSYAFVGLKPSSAELASKILALFPEVVFVSKVEDLALLHSSKIATDSKVVYDYFSAKEGTEVLYDSTLLDKKIEKVYQCIEDALSKNVFDIHSFEI